MRRILIIGSGGAGKSNLARALGESLDIPVHHLDRIFWKPGWVASPREEFERRQTAILATPAWIVDGNFGGTLTHRLAACDTVIFLDLPTLTCLWGAMRRYVRYRKRTRPDMTDGNLEKLDANYLWWILSYRWTRRATVLRRLENLAPGQSAVVLTSRAETAAFLSAAREHAPGLIGGAATTAPAATPRRKTAP